MAERLLTDYVRPCRPRPLRALTRAHDPVRPDHRLFPSGIGLDAALARCGRLAGLCLVPARSRLRRLRAEGFESAADPLCRRGQPGDRPGPGVGGHEADARRALQQRRLRHSRLRRGSAPPGPCARFSRSTCFGVHDLMAPVGAGDARPGLAGSVNCYGAGFRALQVARANVATINNALEGLTDVGAWTMGDTPTGHPDRSRGRSPRASGKPNLIRISERRYSLARLAAAGAKYRRSLLKQACTKSRGPTGSNCPPSR